MTDRIVVACEPCGLSMDVPDHAFGQAMRDLFEQDHANHRTEETTS